MPDIKLTKLLTFLHNEAPVTEAQSFRLHKYQGKSQTALVFLSMFTYFGEYIGYWNILSIQLQNQSCGMFNSSCLKEVFAETFISTVKICYHKLHQCNLPEDLQRALIATFLQ